jgi:hypothetical protein
MPHFPEFKFAQAQTRRRKTLSEVMPMGEAWSYFVVLSDAYLSTEDGEKHIRSFSDLQSAMGCGDSLSALQMVCTSGKLTEGRHELPDIVASYLAQFGEGPWSVRQWSFGASESSTKMIASSDIAGAWAGSDIEEIEVADQSAQWYFRMREDAPLVFLAVRAGPLLDQIRHCNAFCREVSGDLEYAR